MVTQCEFAYLFTREITYIYTEILAYYRSAINLWRQFIKAWELICDVNLLNICDVNLLNIYMVTQHEFAYLFTREITYIYTEILASCHLPMPAFSLQSVCLDCKPGL